MRWLPGTPDPQRTDLDAGAHWHARLRRQRATRLGDAALDDDSENPSDTTVRDDDYRPPPPPTGVIGAPPRAIPDRLGQPTGPRGALAVPGFPSPPRRSPH